MIKDVNKIGKFYAYLILGFIILVAIGIPLQRNAWKKYPTVQFQSEVKGEINKLWNNRGIFGELKSGQKFSFPTTYNYNYEPNFISDFIKKGDFILKPANSDSIFIFRNDKKYFFVIGKSIKKH